MIEIIYRIKNYINEIMYFFMFFMVITKLGQVYNYKNKIVKYINILIVIIILRQGYPYNYITLHDYVTHLLSLMLICKISYKLDFKKTFIYSAIYEVIYKVSRIVLHYLMLVIHIFILEKLKSNNIISLDTLQIILGILEISIWLVINLIVIRKLDEIKKLYKNKKFYIYTILTISVNIIIILFLNKTAPIIYDMYSIVSKNNINYNFNWAFMSFVNFTDSTLMYIIIMINIILIKVFIDAIKSEKENAKVELMNEKLDMQYNYYLTVKESQEKIRSLYHDINNHMNNIKSLKNNTLEVNEYIDSIEDEVKYIKNVYTTENLLLDIILNEKSKICNKNNIEFICDINFSKCDFMQMIDISSIFSNLLDNAIEACNKINNENIKKYITIRGTFVKGYYVIKCENSKANEIKIKKNKFLTSKKDKNNHGIGIENIKSSIKKYDGELKIEIEIEKFVSIIYIPIK